MNQLKVKGKGVYLDKLGILFFLLQEVVAGLTPLLGCSEHLKELSLRRD